MTLVLLPVLFISLVLSNSVTAFLFYNSQLRLFVTPMPTQLLLFLFYNSQLQLLVTPISTMSPQYLVNERELTGVNDVLWDIYNRLEDILKRPRGQATPKKVEAERLRLLTDRSENIRGYLVYSNANSANEELWHVALRCEICNEEEWKVWHYLQSKQDAIRPWRVTENNNGRYVYCQKCEHRLPSRPAPSNYLCAC